MRSSVFALFLLSGIFVKADAGPELNIQSISVNGKALPFQSQAVASLGTYPESVIFGFGLTTNYHGPALHLRCRLNGYENNWHEGDAEMRMIVRFYNAAGDQVSQNIYSVKGQSMGWTGSLKTSALTHRRETIVVPPQANRILIVISSAGPPDTIGIYVVANLVVSKASDTSGNVPLLQSPFDNDASDRSSGDPPKGWMHDGLSPSMAKVVKFGQAPQTKAFAIIDEDPIGHVEWHNILEQAPTVTPGDNLVVEWNEMYSMGTANFHEARYDGLGPGNYEFQVEAVDAMGVLTGLHDSVRVFVPQPFWKTPWFWAVAVVCLTRILAAVSRYFVWQRMRREMARLKQQRAVEQERLRIAHDIHDDLGARVTQISLLSAMAQGNADFPEAARNDFDKVSKMSRELVSALYETVWAVNPENDNLEALGNYLCQMVNQLCERTQLRCRFHVLDLPPEAQVSSQTRHNITMAVKEAVHNVIKHASAQEITVRINYADGFLNISIADDGRGFKPASEPSGNGLNNMKQRLNQAGGQCFVESAPGCGTTVRMRLLIKPAGLDA